MKDRPRFISSDERDGEARQPVTFIVLGIVLLLLGIAWLYGDGAAGVGWAFAVVGGAVALFGIIGQGVLTGLRAHDERPARPAEQSTDDQDSES